MKDSRFLLHVCRLGLEAKKEENLAEWYSQVSMPSFGFYASISQFSGLALCSHSKV